MGIEQFQFGQDLALEVQRDGLWFSPDKAFAALADDIAEEAEFVGIFPNLQFRKENLIVTSRSTIQIASGILTSKARWRVRHFEVRQAYAAERIAVTGRAVEHKVVLELRTGKKKEFGFGTFDLGAGDRFLRDRAEAYARDAATGITSAIQDLRARGLIVD